MHAPMYEPLRVSKCRKCGKVIAEPKELIGIEKEYLGVVVHEGESKESSLGIVEGFQEER